MNEKVEISRGFTYVFVAVFLVVAVILSYAYWIVSKFSELENLQMGIWSAITILFVIFGIVIISLFMKWVREKSDSSKREAL